MKGCSKKCSPWLWVPTLYFAEGIPYFVVNSISVIMFNRMGMPNGKMALLTSLLYLPWVVKPLWSSFVDVIRTKRWWVTSMQLVISACFILLALTIPYKTYSLILIIFWITALASATHDIAADGFYMLALSESGQSFFVGVRSTFYRLATVFGQGVLVVVAGLLEVRMGKIAPAWSYTLLITALIFSAVTLWHLFFLPRPERSAAQRQSTALIVKGLGQSIGTFFRKRGVLAAMVFLLLYRLPEAFLVKMLNPFMLASVEDGGLGLSTAQVGVVYGTAGIAALTIGGILGGMAVSRWGLKKCLWPMALSLAVPSLAFIGLSVFQPSSIWVTAFFICLDQFGYGFGFTAYMLYMIYFSRGEFKTSHYSLCTAFMALSMMLPGLVAGYLQELLGYTGFFIMVGVCCLITVGVTFLLKIEDGYGRK